MIGLLLKLIPTPGLVIRLVTFMIGIMYPTYNSFLAIESHSDEDDKQWLTYWVVVCSLQMIERPAYIVLYWFPFYNVFRLALVAWLAHPQFKGATLVYDIVARPFLEILAEAVKDIPALAPLTERFAERRTDDDPAAKSKPKPKFGFLGVSKKKPAAVPEPAADTAAPAAVQAEAPTLATETAAAVPFLPSEVVEGSLAAKAQEL